MPVTTVDHAGSMTRRMGWRIAVGALVAELVPILALVGLVAAFGPAGQAQANAFAERLGRWVGPIGGAIMCFLGGWWVGRLRPSAGLIPGLALGTLAAGLDVTILVISAVPLEWLFLGSNVGRVIAGALGGAKAGRLNPEGSVPDGGGPETDPAH